MRIVRVVAATVLAAAFMSAPSVAGASPPSVAPALRQQVYSWEWADGSVAKERTFRSSKYANRMKQIAVLVQVRPTRPRHTVKIEVYQQGKWQTHVRTKTSARTGRARLQINPICSSGNWCKGTFNLRLRVLRKGGQNPATLALKVTFDPGSSSSPVVPPPSKPKSLATLSSPIMFQVAENETLGPPSITSVQALQNPDKHSEIVIDVTWDAPVVLHGQSGGGLLRADHRRLHDPDVGIGLVCGVRGGPARRADPGADHLRQRSPRTWI